MSEVILKGSGESGEMKERKKSQILEGYPEISIHYYSPDLMTRKEVVFFFFNSLNVAVHVCICD